MWKSFINGLLAWIFGIIELAIWLGRKIQRRRFYYNQVNEIWLERSLPEMVLYCLGLSITFICISLISKIIDILPNAFICFVLFSLFTLITLVLPVGSRRRYDWLCPKQKTGKERLFLGQMQSDLLLSSTGHGALASLYEVLFHLLLIIIFAAFAQYTIFVDPKIGTNSFAITHAPLSNAGCHTSSGWVTIFTFLYWSIITIATVGYGDISPGVWQSQLVASLEIIVGWMYIAAIVPILINLSSSFRNHTLKAEEGLKTESPTLKKIIKSADDWLLNQPYPSQGWMNKLTPDMAATVFVYCLLKDASNHFDVEDVTVANLRTWIEKNRDEADFGGYALSEIILNNKLTEGEIRGLIAKASSKYAREDHVELLLAFLLLFLEKISSVDAANMLPNDLGNWDDKYGSHWGTYQVLCTLIASDQNKSDEIFRENISKLISNKNSSGSWHGDVILTCMSALTLRRLREGWSHQMDAVSWIKNLIGEGISGAPLFSGLDIWDAGWNTYALLQSGGPLLAVKHNIEWLRDCQLNGNGGWSWFEGSNLICCDTSSLVCSVMKYAEFKDVSIERTIFNSQTLLKSVHNGYVWPTFVDNGKSIQSCPIISSRCISFLDMDSNDRLNAANKIISDVALRENLSIWFSDPLITKGLCTFYLAPYCNQSSEAIKKLVDLFLGVAVTPDTLTVEGASCILLGLLESRKYFKWTDIHHEAMQKLINRIVSSQNSAGYWPGGYVGIFGFGRRYANHVFATSVASIALTRCYRASAQN